MTTLNRTPTGDIIEPKSVHQIGTAGCKYTTHTHKYSLKKNMSISPQVNYPSVSNKQVLLEISFPHKPGHQDFINANSVTGTKGLLLGFPLFLCSLTVSVVAWLPVWPRNVMCRPGFQTCASAMFCASLPPHFQGDTVNLQGTQNVSCLI